MAPPFAAPSRAPSIATRVPETFAAELLGYKRLRERKLLNGDRAIRGARDTRAAPAGWQNAKKSDQMPR
jgi:hypothetical protein